MTDAAIVVKFLNQTEGRDKFSKLMQNVAKMLAHVSTEKTTADQMSNLAKNTADARKIFRLGKWLSEYVKLQEILKSTGNKNADSYALSVQFASRLFFAGYWVYDNLVILRKIKVLQSGDLKSLSKRAAFFWTLGLLTGILLELYKLQKNLEKEKVLLAQEREKSRAEGDGEQSPETASARKSLASERFTIYINIAKNLGDLVTATNGIELPHKIFGDLHSGILRSVHDCLDNLFSSWQLSV